MAPCHGRHRVGVDRALGDEGLDVGEAIANRPPAEPNEAGAAPSLTPILERPGAYGEERSGSAFVKEGVGGQHALYGITKIRLDQLTGSEVYTK